jgi:hypothetical protein
MSFCKSYNEVVRVHPSYMPYSLFIFYRVLSQFPSPRFLRICSIYNSPQCIYRYTYNIICLPLDFKHTNAQNTVILPRLLYPHFSLSIVSILDSITITVLNIPYLPIRIDEIGTVTAVPKQYNSLQQGTVPILA